MSTTTTALLWAIHLSFKAWLNLFLFYSFLYLWSDKNKQTYCIFVLQYKHVLVCSCYEWEILNHIISFNTYTQLEFNHLVFFSLLKSNLIKLTTSLSSIIIWRWLIIQFKIPNFVFWLNTFFFSTYAKLCCIEMYSAKKTVFCFNGEH